MNGAFFYLRSTGFYIFYFPFVFLLAVRRSYSSGRYRVYLFFAFVYLLLALLLGKVPCLHSFVLFIAALPRSAERIVLSRRKVGL